MDLIFFTWHCMSITCETYIHHRRHHCIERDSHTAMQIHTRWIPLTREWLIECIKGRVNKVLWYVKIWETVLFTANWITQRGALRISNKSFTRVFFLFEHYYIYTVTIIHFSILSFESHTHLRFINYIYAYIYI